MKLFFRKAAGGALIPDNEETAEYMGKVKLGEVLACEVTKPHNYQFFKKLHSLARLSFDHFCDALDGGVEYKGVKAKPSYQRFRKDMTILAGHWEATFDIRGELKLEAKSWAWANCSQEEHEQIYSDFINAALRQVFKQSVTEEQLREMVDNLLAFA